MPTTAEVEDRLRHIATACEPLIEDLMDLDPTTPTVIALDRPGRRRRAPWLAAAAVVVVAAVSAAVLVTGDDAPNEDVRATPRMGTTPPPPGAGVLLPDGSRVVVTIPGPRTWTPGRASVLVDVDGHPDDRSVSIAPGSIDDLVAAGATIDLDLGDGRALVTDGDGVGQVAVAHDGWVATVDVSAPDDAEATIGDDVLLPLARGLDFAVTPDGPVDVTGPGLTVIGADRSFTGGDPDALVVVRREGGRPIADCAGTFPPILCFADDTVLAFVTAPVDELAALGAGIEVDGAAGPEASAPRDRREVALPNGTAVEIETPRDPAWSVAELWASVRIEGVLATRDVDLRPVAGAADEPAALVEEGGDAWVAVTRSGWQAQLPLVTGGVELVPPGLWDRLVASFTLTATSRGVTAVAADGLTVIDGAGFALWRAGATDGTNAIRFEVSPDPRPCRDDGSGRCAHQGRVQVVAVGEGEALTALADVVVGSLTTPG